MILGGVGVDVVGAGDTSRGFVGGLGTLVLGGLTERSCLGR